ncbi:Hypothetical protein, putative, partial [Bodo saltans]
MSALPADLTVQPMINGPTYPALEGYVAVRWVGEVMSMMPNINQSLFLDAIYRRKYFWLNDVTVGPLSDHCLVDSTSDLTCFCNVAMNNFYIGRVSPTTGTAVYLPYDSYYDPKLVTTSLPLSQCYLQQQNLLFLMTFALWYEASQLSMKALSYAFNAASGSEATMFASATYMPNIMQTLPNETLLTFEERLYATR